MKYQGRIQQWDDAKGYGFVEPNVAEYGRLLISKRLNSALGALLMATLLFMKLSRIEMVITAPATSAYSRITKQNVYVPISQPRKENVMLSD